MTVIIDAIGGDWTARKLWPVIGCWGLVWGDGDTALFDWLVDRGSALLTPV